MTIAIFIAKDHKEFSRYAGEEVPGFKKQVMRSGRPIPISEPSGIKTLAREGSIRIVVIDRTDEVSELKKKIQGGLDCQDALSNFIKFLGKKVAKCGGQINQNDITHVFCHWGNGGGKDGVAAMDIAFQDEFKSWKSLNRGYDAWQVHAISSMREEIFGVNVKDELTQSGRFDIKHLPQNVADIESLANALDRESDPYKNFTYSCKIERIVSCDDFKNIVLPNSNVPLFILPVSADPPVSKLETAIKNLCKIKNVGIKEINDIKDNDIKDGVFVCPIFIDFEYKPVDDNGKEQPLVRIIDDSGFAVPEEFVLRFEKGRDGKTDSQLTFELFEDLCDRIAYWEQDSTLRNGICTKELRDWMAGAFRIFCFHDKDVHGTASSVDWDEAKKSPQDFWNHYSDRIKARLEKKDGLSWQIPYWKVFYPDEIEIFENAVKNNPETCFYKTFCEEDKKALVEYRGFDVAYLSPTCQLSGLLIDDDANNEKIIGSIKGKIAETENSSEPFVRDVFSFDPIYVSVAEEGTVISQARKKFQEIKGQFLTHDFVLLDLRLKDAAGEDPSGYYLISQVKQFFPHLPIIIYSRYDDMGHMSRAFQMGADWFIRKDEIRKLPRHIKSVVSRLNWHKEWEAISRLGLWREPTIDCEDQVACAKFRSELSEERKYLLYKSLESLPGINIAISPLGGGFSSSTTFRACKVTTTDEGKRLQNPVIVKMDMAFNTMSEYERYFRFIRPYIANESGRIESKELTLDRNNLVIVYTFAGRQSESYELNSMYDMLRRDIKNRSSCNYKSYEAAFDVIFNEILPRIHVVKPRLEFGVVADNPSDQPSDFPNLAFGEVAVDVMSATKERLITSNDFLANWLCRMPLGRKLEEFKFVAQSKVKESSAEGVIHRYEFCRKDNIDGHGVIEALDFEDKCTIVMTGANVDHVVKYRPHTYPCMTLWVDKCANPDIILEEAIPGFVKKAVEKLHDGKEIGQYRASNEFAEILKRLMNEPLSAGRPSDDFYKMKDPKDKVRGSEFWEGAFLEIDNKENTAFNTLPSLFKAAKELLNGTLAKKIIECPAGIVHGDLNYANIMLETKKRLSGDSVFTTDISDVKDVWLIDFARTRRDLIAHDFNVLFTSTLGLLFDLDVWRSEETIAHDIYYCSMRQFWGERAKVNDTISYSRFIETIFRPFVVRAVFDKLDAVPDGMEHDNRLVLIFKILRRIRAAALKAGMTEESYAFTTALACMVASRVYIVHEENAPAAAAMIATAFICLAKLKRVEMEANNG